MNAEIQNFLVTKQKPACQQWFSSNFRVTTTDFKAYESVRKDDSTNAITYGRWKYFYYHAHCAIKSKKPDWALLNLLTPVFILLLLYYGLFVSFRNFHNNMVAKIVLSTVERIF